MKDIYIAPVQGHTDAAWRHFHHETYGGDNRYFTPFIRCEHSGFRKQDLRDFNSELNTTIDLEPQVIFRDMTELNILLAKLSADGATRINLNMGCPFPLQTGKGRGAGFIGNTEEAAKLPETLAKYPEVSFSVKMRLGYENPEEWRGIIGILNSLQLRHVDVHPRVARQQYGGELHIEQFRELLAESRNPIVFNGDIRTPGEIAETFARFPKISGVMTARGVLSRPSIIAEYAEGREWSREERIEKMLRFHRELFEYYTATLCGDAQLLSKIKPFWEYSEEEIGRKPWKAIKKSTNIAKYHSAVAQIQ